MQMLVHQISMPGSVGTVGLVAPSAETQPGAARGKKHRYSAVELCAADYIQDLPDKEGDRRIRQLEAMARHLISNFRGKTLLVSSSGEPRGRSKLRTYKGVYGDKQVLKHSRVLQREINARDNLTILVAVADMHESELDEGLRISWDFVRNCFCLIDKKVPDEEVLADATRCIHLVDGYLDFPCLTERVCERGGYTLRLSRSQRLSLT